nr:hypothetical protein [uncultured Desulfuromonas sp.]
MRNVFLAILIFLLGLPTHAPANEVALRVVASTATSQEEFSLSDLKRIFLGKTRSWRDGEQISLVINTNELAMDQFCRSIVRKTPRQYTMYWRKQLYSGHSMLPVQRDSDEQVIDYLTEHSGAIGFILSPVTDPRIKELMISQ